MNQLLTPQNLLKGFTIAIYVNIAAFFLSLLIGVVWFYLLFSFWDWEHFFYLCIFYSATLLFTLLLKKWYVHYLTSNEFTS